MFRSTKKKGNKSNTDLFAGMNSLELTDDDLNDKSLLSEYQSLMNDVLKTTQKMAPAAPQKQKQNQNRNISNMNNSAAFDITNIDKNLLPNPNLLNTGLNLNFNNIDDDIEVEITDEDLNDPELLNELNQITGGKADKIVNGNANDISDVINDKDLGINKTNLIDMNDIMDNKSKQPKQQQYQQNNIQNRQQQQYQQNNMQNQQQQQNYQYRQNQQQQQYYQNIQNQQQQQNYQYMQNQQQQQQQQQQYPQSNTPNYQIPQVPSRNQSQPTINIDDMEILSLEEKLNCNDLNQIEKYINYEKYKANQKIEERDVDGAKICLDNLKALDEKFKELSAVKEAQEKAKAEAEAKALEQARAQAQAEAETLAREQARAKAEAEALALEQAKAQAQALALEQKRAQVNRPENVMNSQQQNELYGKSNDEILRILKDREHEYKVTTVNYNRQGRKAEACNFLKTYKMIENAIKIFSTTGNLPMNFVLPASLSTPGANGSSHSINSSLSTHSSSKEINKISNSSSSNFETRSVSYSQSSINSINSNNSNRQSAQAISVNQTSQVQNNSRSHIINQSGKSFKSAEQGNKFYSDIESKLNDQITKCTSAIKLYYSKENKPEALRIYRIKKSLTDSLEDIKILKSQLSIGNMQIPNFNYIEVPYITENVNNDVGLSEMCIEILKAEGLTSREVKSGQFNSYVVVNTHYPTDDSPNSTFQTDIVNKSNDPEFKFRRKIPIQRGKPMIRYVEKKKITFEIFHNPGFLRKNISLGKVNVRLDQLRRSSEIYQKANLCDSNNPRKVLTGKLEYKIKLQIPLMEHEFLTKTEKWVVLDTKTESNQQSATIKSSLSVSSISSNNSNHQKALPIPTINTSQEISVKSRSNVSSPSNPPSSNASPQRLSASSDNNRLATPSTPQSSRRRSLSASSNGRRSPNVASNNSPSSPASNTPPPPQNEELEELIETFENPVNMVSNEVLESEQKLLQSQVAEAKVKKLATYEQLNDRLQAVNFQIQMLVTKIESGILTLPDYVQQVTDCIAKTKKMAITFKKYGRIDLAKKALIRIKIMEKELEESNEDEEE